MKRMGYLYQEIYKFENILSSYNEVCKNTRNKKRVSHLKEYKSFYISRVHNILESNSLKRIKDRNVLKIVFAIFTTPISNTSIFSVLTDTRPVSTTYIFFFPLYLIISYVLSPVFLNSTSDIRETSGRKP